MPPRLTHITLHVRDLDTMVAFHEDYCGLSDPDGKCVELSYGPPLGPGAADETSGRDRATAGAGGAEI